MTGTHRHSLGRGAVAGGWVGRSHVKKIIAHNMQISPNAQSKLQTADRMLSLFLSFTQVQVQVQ